MSARHKARDGERCCSDRALLGTPTMSDLVLPHRFRDDAAFMADLPYDPEVLFVEEPDEIINPLGIKGVGEIGVVGTAAAIANAVYHATGKRVRDLPITPGKLV